MGEKIGCRNFISLDNFATPYLKCGRWEENIKTLSNILEKDFDEKINIITKLLEPMVMIFLGGIVVFMMILIFVPVYECIKYV